MQGGGSMQEWEHAGRARRRIPAVAAVAAGLLAVGACPAMAEADGLPVPPALEVFFREFRAAAQAGDAERLARFAHSASRACGVESDSAHLRGWKRIAGQYARIFGHDLAVKRIDWEPTDPAELAEAKARMAERGGARFPVDPEGALEVHWETDANRARAAQLHVARDAGGAWRWVHVCLEARQSQSAP